MRSGLVVLFFALIVGGVGFVIVNQEEKSNLSVTLEEIVIHSGDLDFCFTRGKRFENTYMLFGGEHITGKNAVMPVCISGIEAEDGKDIASRHADFWECKSPGATLAQSCCTQMQLVPSRPRILETLNDTLKDYKKSLGKEQDRVCVTLQGNILKLKSVILVEQDQDVTSKFTNQFESLDCRLVTEAQKTGWQQVLNSNK
ncbi:MAG: hypothetical protein ABIK28_17705 [Planctomycetota bacterium]